ncbi:hypothetical protein DH2020_002602 [Rehmannia glutinosa]|uniref:Peptidase A1 domain-containing protein n=1 Tax=Rehmannia glutinosa TaxID=99300 RepID=A0ABR0XUE9_REHGL
MSLVSLSRCDNSLTKANSSGLTIDLIHRDSPQSPYYDPSLSPTQRLVNSMRRSLKRVQRFNESHFRQWPESDVIESGGEYLVEFSIGAPPVKTIGTLDTGSNLIWTQCQPCIKCFKQNLTFYRPRLSNTYRKISCKDPFCSYTQKTFCSTRTDTCLYTVTYADKTYSGGALGTDILTLKALGGTTTAVNNVIFGCGYRNGGRNPGGEYGVVGLGGGKVSLIRQLGYLAQGKFSYCLTSQEIVYTKLSTLNFGDNAMVSGSGTVVTPLVRKLPDTFYFVSLYGISVGNQRLVMYEPTYNFTNNIGNMIVDSGSSLTMLPSDFYAKLKKALVNSVNLRTIKDPDGVCDLCFYTRQDNIKFPDITFHFHGSPADVKFKQENMFFRTSDDSYCLSVLPTKGPGVLGCLAQANFLVGFDLERQQVSFKPTDCGKFFGRI